MPIHDLGYRAWQGTLVPEVWRFWAITETGIRLAWQNRWLRRLLFAAWLPAFYLAVGFLMYEQWMAQALPRDAMLNFLPGFPATPDRHHVWSWLLWIFFRYPQGFLMVLVVGLIAPPLVAQDVRSRAFLLYFSRPITRIEYLLGKMAVVWGYLLLIVTAPALTLYVAGVLFSPHLGVVGATWDLPLRIAAASVLLMAPTTALALAFSSMTSETRIATFAWIAVWVLGWVTYGVAMANLGSAAGPSWNLVSLYHTLGKVEGWVFGMEDRFSEVLPAAVLLAAITAASLAVVYRRISAPMRV